MLEVRRLRLLRELSLRGTIAATAKACSLTPSAVSQQLNILEREVRTPLLIRDGSRLVLTAAAHVLVEHTERILADLEQAQAAVAGHSSGVHGVARIAAFPSAAGALVAPAITRCRDKHPDLRAQLSEMEPPEAIAGVRAGHVDVALIYEYNLLAGTGSPGVELVELVAEPLYAALPSDGLPAEQATTLAALSRYPWVAPEGDTALRRTIENACELVGFQPRFDYTSDDYTVILALVGAGLGVTLIPRLALESLSADVRVLEVAEPELRRTVYAAVRAGSRADPVIEAVLSALAESADQLADQPAM